MERRSREPGTSGQNSLSHLFPIPSQIAAQIKLHTSPFSPQYYTNCTQRDPQQQLKDNHAKFTKKPILCYKQLNYLSLQPIHEEWHSATQLPQTQRASSSKRIPEHLQKAYAREMTTHAIALAPSSVCWLVVKDKQPVNWPSKQFLISYCPDSRGTLCFPLHSGEAAAKRGGKDEASHLPC